MYVLTVSFPTHHHATKLNSRYYQKSLVISSLNMIPPGIIEVYDSFPGTWQISHIVSTPEIDSQIECRISESGVGIELVDFIDRRCLNYAMPCEGTHTDISLFRLIPFSAFPFSLLPTPTSTPFDFPIVCSVVQWFCYLYSLCVLI